MDITKIKVGTRQDKNEIVRFIDYVFSKTSRPHDFASMLPKLFSAECEKENFAYLIHSKNKIVAAAYAVPLKVSMGNSEYLNGKCIGTVAVDSAERGKGYMKAIMQKINADIQNQGCDFAVLGGQRQRYEYFDYTPAGFVKNIYITQTNIAHGLKTIKTKPYSFLPLEENQQYLDDVFNLYCHNLSQHYGCVREKTEFINILKSWYFKPYVILMENHFAGYLNCFFKDEILQINEFYLHNPEDTLYICKDLFGLAGYCGIDNCCLTKSLMFKVNPYQDDLSRQLSEVCENYNVFGEQAFNIFNYERVVNLLMRKKYQKNALQEGVVILNIQDYGLLRVKIENGYVESKKLDIKDQACNNDIISLTKVQATALLFSIKSEEFDFKVPSGWFPLKISIPNSDLC